MTQLGELLKRRARREGPIRVDEFMALCLMHPEYGYYNAQEVFGREGDFITAPEVSQMFGELIGLSLAQTWINQGSPADAIVVELGPGRGRLMQDIKRATRKVPGFCDLPVHMVEASTKLRAIQADVVPGVIHHDKVDDLPQAPIFLVANEFFDALPIRQFKRAEGGWNEGYIGHDPENDDLIYGLGPVMEAPFLAARATEIATGDVVEYCTALPQIVEAIAGRIAANGGAAVMIDYGGWALTGNTLQSMEAHKHVPILTKPGQVDLTAHVDFREIAQAAKGVTVSEMITQADYLTRLGLDTRKAMLAKAAPAMADQLDRAHHVLTDPARMGELFKVLGLARTAAELPAGLDTAG